MDDVCCLWQYGKVSTRGKRSTQFAIQGVCLCATRKSSSARHSQYRTIDMLEANEELGTLDKLPHELVLGELLVDRSNAIAHAVDDVHCCPHLQF